MHLQNLSQRTVGRCLIYPLFISPFHVSAFVSPNIHSAWAFNMIELQQSCACAHRSCVCHFPFGLFWEDSYHKVTGRVYLFPRPPPLDSVSLCFLPAMRWAALLHHNLPPQAQKKMETTIQGHKHLKLWTKINLSSFKSFWSLIIHND